jgi:hypothetical protein
MVQHLCTCTICSCASCTFYICVCYSDALRVCARACVCVCVCVCVSVCQGLPPEVVEVLLSLRFDGTGLEVEIDAQCSAGHQPTLLRNTLRQLSSWETAPGTVVEFRNWDWTAPGMAQTLAEVLPTVPQLTFRALDYAPLTDELLGAVLAMGRTCGSSVSAVWSSTQTDTLMCPGRGSS